MHGRQPKNQLRMNRRLAAIFLATTFAAACVRRVDFGAHGQQKDVEALEALTAAAEESVYAVKGEAKLKLDTPQAKGGVTLFVAVSHPALIHLESLDFFGRPQAVLVSDGARFGLYRADEGRYYRGPATAANLGRFLPVALPPRELTALLLGRAPRIPHESGELAFLPEAGTYRVTLHEGGVTQTLRVDPKSYRVLDSQVAGVNTYSLVFEGLETSRAGVFPRRIALRTPAAEQTVELRYTDIEVNEAPDLTLFELEPPGGSRVVEVDEAGIPRKDQGP